MIITENLSHPPSLGKYLEKSVEFAFTKMNLKVPFGNKREIHTSNCSIFWIIALGNPETIVKRKVIASLTKSLTNPNISRKICISIDFKEFENELKAIFGASIVIILLPVIGDPKFQKYPMTPGLYDGKPLSTNEKNPYIPQPQTTPLNSESIVGFYMAKILSRMLQGEKILSISIGLPQKAMIEISRSCNLQCFLCPVGNSQAKQMPFMSATMFENIIDLIAPTIWKAKLYNYGEPLLHPQLPDFIKLTKRKGIEKVEISTNGVLLDRSLSVSLIDSKLDFIRISIDGIDQNIYEKYRRGGNVNIVWHNIREFRKLRNAMGKSLPIIEVQCLATCHTEYSLNELEQKALDNGADRFRVKTFNVFMSGERFANLGKHYLPLNHKLSRYLDHSELGYKDRYSLSKCNWPLQRLVILADGTIVPCCYDYNADFVLGSFKNSREHWWWTSKRKDFINRLNRSLNSIRICSHCPVGVPDLTAKRNV